MDGESSIIEEPSAAPPPVAAEPPAQMVTHESVPGPEAPPLEVKAEEVFSLAALGKKSPRSRAGAAKAMPLPDDKPDDKPPWDDTLPKLVSLVPGSQECGQCEHHAN